MMIVISVLVFLMWGSLVAIEPSYLMSSDASDDEILSLVMPVLGYASLLVLVAIVFVVWIFIVSIKGLKIVSGFSTAKAFGLVILVMIISSLVTAPLGM